MNDLTKVRKSVMEETQVLPEMAGQSGKVLSNNGSMPRWIVGRYVGELIRVSMDIAPPGCFALDGSRIVNGKNDFTALANCGSRFITISGNDLILADCRDFERGKGSSGRSVGSFEGDAIRNIVGKFGGLVPLNYTLTGKSEGSLYESYQNQSWSIAGANYLATATPSFDASRVVPTSHENRPKSLTELVCIYHGVI